MNLAMLPYEALFTFVHHGVLDSDRGKENPGYSESVPTP